MNEFILFSYEHFLFIGCGVLGIILLLFLSTFFNKKTFGRVSSIFILILKLLELLYRNQVDNEPITSLLPFHLCNITLILIIIMMFTNGKALFQPCYFWSIGALFAIITPELTTSFPNFVTISFFVTHFYILFGVIYFYFINGTRPTFRGYIASFILLNIICLIVFFINNKLGTNYLYINRLPNFKSPLMYFGKWPNYIIVVEGIYLFITFIIYRLFRKKNTNYTIERYY